MRCLWEIFAVMSAVDVLIYRTCCQCCYSVEVSLTYLFTYITKFNQTKTIQRSQNRISGNPVKKNNLTSFLNLYEYSYKVKYVFIILFVLQDKSDLPWNLKFATWSCNPKVPRRIWICFNFFLILSNCVNKCTSDQLELRLNKFDLIHRIDGKSHAF